ncbi:MAG: hypothetical protein FJ104_05770, partial [Deltaproteobacteria bacterium]|nr:hypothetical protein [Deltaproteobacteria bacterium]
MKATEGGVHGEALEHALGRDPVRARAAVRRLSDRPDLLEQIALAGERGAAEAALALLAGGAPVVGVALGARDAVVAKEAAKRLGSDAERKRVIEESRHPLARRVALKQLEAEAVLASVAASELDAELCLAALERLTERGALGVVARTARHEALRVAALARVEDG